MQQGDIFWIDFPGGAGRAQAGRRPAVMLQGATASARLPTTLVVPLTSKQDALRFPGTVLIEPDENNGLKVPSVALVFQLTAIDQKFVSSRIGSIDETKTSELMESLDELMVR